MRRLGRGYLVATGTALAAGVALLGWLVLGGNEQPRVSSGAPSGRLLYETHCAVCHGVGGRGDGPGAMVHRQPMRDFSDPAAMHEVNDQFLVEIIKKGSSQFGRSNAMPAWGMKLSDEEIRAVVAYIRSLAHGSFPSPAPRKESP